MIPDKLFKKDNDFDKSIETKPVSAEDYYTEGETRFNAGHYTQAMEYFQATIEECPDRGIAYLKLSETYIAMDRKKDAIAILYKLLSLQPDNSAAYKLVTQLHNLQSIEHPIIHSKKNMQATENAGSDNQRISFNGVSFEMVYVEGGTFTMGATSELGGKADSDELPTHSVTLSSYYIGKTQVTQALWKVVMGSNPSYNKGDDLPVEQVSWDECQEFIRKLNQITGKIFRLPTEAEWEYAARGGNKSRGNKYSGSNDVGTVAWYEGNSNYQTHPVGKKSSNELDVYDMSGNVWEWCQDWYGNYSISSQTNPTGPKLGSFRVFRGGSWFCDVKNCRMSLRSHCSPDTRLDYIGLRLVLVN